MDEIDKIRKKVKKDAEKNIEVHPDSDIPITEKKTKQKKFMFIDEDDEEKMEEE
ncbi:MAG: hypothetical protein ACE5DM_04225 [Candidatus Nanoarchaeia archaeon]